MTAKTDEEWKAAVYLYYRRMSEAMARSCDGEALVLSDDVDRLDQPFENIDNQPSIWWSHELPTLRCLYQENIITRLTAVNNITKTRVDRTDVLESGTKTDNCLQ